MGISLYYTASRPQPLTKVEHALMNDLIARYDDAGFVEEFGEEYDGESFHVYDPDDPSEPGVIFEGATRLPGTSEEAFWQTLQHWCRLLTEIRRALQGTAWHVHLDDHDIPWDEQRRVFDPSE